MKRLLLVAAPIAGLLASAGPAGAQHWSDRDSWSAASVNVHRGPHGSVSNDRRFTDSLRCDRRSGFDRDRRHHSDGDRRRSGRDCILVEGGLGYLDYGDYDANRSFDPDLWNDWWHERPSRAYPRWVQNNDNCTPDRVWWSGSGWHC